jgi:ketosteroid isomerase-like protein
MSQENVEIVKRAIDAFNVRDIDAIYECVTPDLEWFPAMPVTFAGGAFRGREGIESYIREVNEAWEEYRVVGENFRNLGEQVLVLSRVEALGVGSGAYIDSEMGQVYDFRAGRISRIRTYLDHAEAINAAESGEEGDV